MDLTTVIQDCWQVSEDHGWHENMHNETFVVKLMLIVSELAEALEEFRDGRGYNETYYKADNPAKPEGIPVELADALH